jgi:hypothetical protein
VFVTVIFAGKTGAPYGTPLLCKNYTRVANTLAYYDMPIITAVKSSIVQATEVPLNKTLMTKKSSATEFLSFF